MLNKKTKSLLRKALPWVSLIKWYKFWSKSKIQLLMASVAQCQDSEILLEWNNWIFSRGRLRTPHIQMFLWIERKWSRETSGSWMCTQTDMNAHGSPGSDWVCAEPALRWCCRPSFWIRLLSFLKGFQLKSWCHKGDLSLKKKSIFSKLILDFFFVNILPYKIINI